MTSGLRRSGVEEVHLRKILLTLNMLAVVSAHATPQPFVLEPGERPRSGLLARTMLSLGDRAVSLRGNEVQAYQPETQYLIALSDGSRTRAEIAAAMSEALEKDIPLEMVDASIKNLARMRAFEA